MDSTHLKIGFQVAGQFPDGMPAGTELLATARAAEEAGFDSVWAGEHLSFHNPIHDAFVMLAYLAAGTEHIRLGTGIILLPLRQPVWMAKTAASLDQLSGGRLELGIGVGGEGMKDFEGAGVPPAARGARTDEYLDVARALWSGTEISHHGRFVSFDGITIQPGPVQPGGPPLWVGGKSERAALRSVDQGAGWLPAYVSPRQFEEKARLMRARAAATGRPMPPLGAYLHTLVDENDDRAREAARAHFAERYQQPVGDHVLDKLCLVGSPDRVRERVEEYRALGLTDMVFIPLAPWDHHRDQAALLAERVMRS
ncbi:LLM class flavin-dependent oxidoreductase [Pseudonocardia nematodicida]|uniref:LLM class flavin-dependent oxidoreductase n=1 Tax=Pseudonocardia nematodicida TaxID=1206997 RepID=A0ABV1KHS0_9PSEU